MIGARKRERTCQEASVMSAATYIPCGRPAVAIVDNGDEHPYWMCDACASHNVRNRRAQAWVPAAMAERVLSGIGGVVPYDPNEAHDGFKELRMLLEVLR